jgi:predicted nuclease of predicted toxin-antitoxin system
MLPNWLANASLARRLDGMKFKIDENLPIEVSRLLGQAGHDAVTVVAQELSGSPDADIASVCQSESRALITLDTDFADIRLYPPAEYPGLIVLRLRSQAKPHVLEIVNHLTRLFQREVVAGRLWIVEEERVRIRE